MAELSAQGPLVAPHGTSVVITTSPSPIPLGSRMRDAAGNEYEYCDFTSTVYGRQPVLIGADHTAAAIAAASARGRIGVACTQADSNSFGWVQIYGRAIMQIGMTGVSPSDDANGPTTLSTSAQTVFYLATSISSPAALAWTSDPSTGGYLVVGMQVASDASPSNDVSGTTSATSHTGSEVAVFLNYPYVRFEFETVS